MSVLDWRLAWNDVLAHSLFAVVLTLIAFQLALMLYRRSGWLVLQPVMIGMLLVVATLTLVGVEYPRYREGAAPIAMLLGPATVALAVPLYRHLRRIRQLFWPIVITLVVGGLLCVALTLAIAWLLGAELPVLMSLAPKSATMPIAMLVAEELGGLASLAAVFVMLTGVIGTALGPLLLRWAGVEHPAARGLSYGINAHAIGTARALEEGDECGAFAALGMSLLGILIALLLPFALG
ncbi:MAG: LrgB family protein [Pseudomonas sp.]|jgi:predicted murein hydrolase (TIGR00659 family)|uniref:LrgB family protein n=1 Tax=Stutzerimonas degradans TaxID=2968968 RepID=A0A1S8EYC1_9GAMM|nr:MULTISPECIES: LrgB family protein [Pseudomonadaceae]MCF6752057.1 LrgB family protein [Stutzerimonas stutzeri]MDT3710458.1 LrgB family protein [Pseudomonadaceae bacterium]MEB2326032.1 LrgB family protein [Pseudomonas sp.]KGK83644.1 membrane protein [Stutzerimonas degradans]MCQ4276898.1 LrgB family protein [Stutzerimonas degradans]